VDHTQWSCVKHTSNGAFPSADVREVQVRFQLPLQSTSAGPHVTILFSSLYNSRDAQARNSPLRADTVKVPHCGSWLPIFLRQNRNRPPHSAVNKILRKCFEGIWTHLREPSLQGFKFYRIYGISHHPVVVMFWVLKYRLGTLMRLIPAEDTRPD
jgi:hypothetical protein